MRSNRVLVAVLALALILRILPIFWGLPLRPHVHGYHPDEYKVQAATADFPGVYVTDERFLMYGTAVSYTLGALLLPLKLVLVEALGLERPYSGLVWLASRLFSVLSGVATVHLLYVLGLRLHGRSTALLAAALLATSFFATLNSPLATLDVPMGFLLVANVLLCLRAFDRPTPGRFAVLGLATGLLAGTKITGAVFVAVPLLLAILEIAGVERGGGRRRLPARELAGRLALYGLVSLVVFAVFHPHVFLEFSRYRDTFLRANYNWVERRATGSWVSDAWVTSTAQAVGVPVAVLAVFGAALALRRPRRDEIGALAFLPVYYLSLRGFLPARYVIPVAPLLCLLAARAVTALAASSARWRRVAGWSAAAVALAWSLWLCLAGIDLRLHDTRPAAALYVAGRFPAGTTLGLSAQSEEYGWTTHKWRFPKVDFTRFREVPLWESPEVVVTSSFDLGPVQRALSSEKLLAGHRWDPEWNRDWYNWSPPSPRLLRFYDELLRVDGPYELERVFRRPVRVPLEFPPPEIRVYRRRAPEDAAAAGRGILLRQRALASTGSTTIRRTVNSGRPPV